jgi:hypothetical protein
MTSSAKLSDRESLAAIFERLSLNQNVTGVLAIGSLAAGTMNAISDYDLVIVLNTTFRPWFVGVTTIDNRSTDLIFVAATAVQTVAALTAPVSPDHELVPIIRWLSTGAIRFDRQGDLGRLQQRLRQGDWIEAIDDKAGYDAWFTINYNLAVAERLAKSEDELGRRTALIRMGIYGHTDIWFGYFTIRKLPWGGDKAAVNHLLAHDQTFLATFQRFLAASTIPEKLRLYRQAAEIAVAPHGGLWPSGATVMNDNRAKMHWQHLIGSVNSKQAGA